MLRWNTPSSSVAGAERSLLERRDDLMGEAAAGHCEGRTADDQLCYLQRPSVGGMLGSEVKRVSGG